MMNKFRTLVKLEEIYVISSKCFWVSLFFFEARVRS